MSLRFLQSDFMKVSQAQGILTDLIRLFLLVVSYFISIGQIQQAKYVPIILTWRRGLSD